MDKKSIAFGFLVGVLVTVGVCFFLLNKSRQIPSSIINDTRTATQSKGISIRISIASIFVDDIQKEYERLKQLGVEFTTEPTKTGTVTIAVFDDTCGNLIQLVEQ